MSGGIGFEIGTSLTCESDSDGWYGVRIDGLGGKRSVLGDALLQSPFGFTSRPVDAANGVGCEVLYAFDGNSGVIAWLGRDARYVSKCPPLTQGSSAQWNSVGAYALLDTETKTWTLHVPRLVGSHEITVGQINGEEVIVVRHSGGATAKITAQKVLVTGAELHVGDSAKLLAIAEKVDRSIANIQRQLDTHSHFYCLGPTGTSVTPCTPEPTVACSKSFSE